MVKKRRRGRASREIGQEGKGQGVIRGFSPVDGVARQRERNDKESKDRAVYLEQGSGAGHEEPRGESALLKCCQGANVREKVLQRTGGEPRGRQ